LGSASGPPRDLLEAALSVAHNAYAPYSKFRVASAVRDERGAVYAGVNVENSSYGLTVCAERNAVFQAVSRGARRIVEVLVVAFDSDEPVYPCGACLQVLAEFSDGSTLVHALSWKTMKYSRATLSELFPRPFGLRSEE